jgi:hypothetical protein
MINSNIAILKLKQSKNFGLQCPVPKSLVNNLLNKAIAAKTVKIENGSFPVFIPKLYTGEIAATFTNRNTASNYIYFDDAGIAQCLQISQKLNPSFSVNRETYDTLTFPYLKNQSDLYNNSDVYNKYFFCYNFINFIGMLQDQMKTTNNGIIINYNTSDGTVSLSVLKQYIDSGKNISFNNDLLDILPFEKSPISNGLYNMVFNKDLILNINNADYFTSSCFPCIFFFDSLFIGLKNNPIVPVEICGSGLNITNIESQELIFMFDLLASGISYNSTCFYADNQNISMYHTFNQNYISSQFLQFEILINVSGTLYSWVLNENDNLPITLLIYNNELIN